MNDSKELEQIIDQIVEHTAKELQLHLYDLVYKAYQLGKKAKNDK